MRVDHTARAGCRRINALMKRQGFACAVACRLLPVLINMREPFRIEKPQASVSRGNQEPAARHDRAAHADVAG